MDRIKGIIMGKVNAQGMAEFEANLQQRNAALRALITTPFDLKNEEQQKKLKQYIVEFEFFANQMYVYQFLQKGVSVWMSSLAAPRYIPESVNSFFYIALYVGVLAHILERFSMTEFYAHLNEMKTLYNWCLKNNNSVYTPEIDNTEILNNETVQQLIKLLAPLCDTDFMIVWPRETQHKEEPKGNWNRTIKAGYLAVAATWSFFSSGFEQLTVEQNRIKEIKENVERRRMDLGVFNGFTHALDYFRRNMQYGGLLHTKLQKQLVQLPEMLPGAGTFIETVSPHLS